jgi:hypothetical protein
MIWALVFAIITIVLSVAVMVHAARGNRATGRATIAGAFAMLNLGGAMLVGATVPRGVVSTVTQSAFAIVGLCFLALEFRLGRQRHGA